MHELGRPSPECRGGRAWRPRRPRHTRDVPSQCPPPWLRLWAAEPGSEVRAAAQRWGQQDEVISVTIFGSVAEDTLSGRLPSSRLDLGCFILRHPPIFSSLTGEEHSPPQGHGQAQGHQGM